MIKAVIFDFAGVIAEEGYWNYLKKHIPDLSAKEEIFLELSRKVDKADISRKEFLRQLSLYTGQKEKEIEKELLQSFILRSKVIELLKKLKKQYKIGLLSNFLKEWMIILFEKNQLDQFFDAKVVSSEEKVAKPDAKIFHIMIERLCVKPEEAIFIDDREVNIKGAEKVGMKGILYTTPEKLITSLKNLECKI